jgi:hypothetical protein
MKATRLYMGAGLALIVILLAISYRLYHERQSDHSQSLAEVQTRDAFAPPYHQREQPDAVKAIVTSWAIDDKLTEWARIVGTETPRGSATVGKVDAHYWDLKTTLVPTLPTSTPPPYRLSCAGCNQILIGVTEADFNQIVKTALANDT